MNIGFDAKRAFWNHTGLGNYSRFILTGLAKYCPSNDYYIYSPGISWHTDMKEIRSFPHVHPVDLGKGVLGKIKRIAGYDLSELEIFHGLSNELPLFVNEDKTKCIVTIHDLLFLRFPTFYPYIDRKIYLAKTRAACKKATKIIAVSIQTKNDLIEFLNIPEEKIVVHYQSCHAQFWKKFSKEEIKKVTGDYKIKHPYILQVGTLEERKNALVTIKAFAESSSRETHQLVLLGRKTPYCDVLYEHVKQYKIQNKVIFIHDSFFSDFPMLYQGAALCVYPSLFEGFGIPLLEAMCCDVPVITSKGGCFDEVTGDAALYINPLNNEELTEAIDKIISNNSLRNEMIINGRKRTQQFTETRLIERLNEIYHAI